MTDGTEADDSSVFPSRVFRIVDDIGSDGPTALSGRTIRTTVAVLLVVYWVSVLGAAFDVHVRFLQAVTGGVLLVVVPGILLYELFDRSDGFGEFVLYSIGLGLVFVSVLLVVLQWTVGQFVRPLTPFVLLGGMSVSVIALTLLSTRGRRSIRFPSIPATRGDVLTAVLLGALPVLAVVAARVWAVYRRNELMYVLVIAIGVAVLSYPLLSRRRYPLVIGSVALATFLHRNLATPSLVGADVQLHYYLAATSQETGYWNVELAGESASVPLVTVAPTVFTTIMGIDLTVTFTVVYSLIVALLPVGIYYLVRDSFGTAPAYFGSFFFLFYHGTFYFTPGKEHVSELFVVLMLLVLVSDRSGPRATVFALLFGLGMVMSHYATSFIFIIALTGCAILLRLAPGIDHRRADRTITLPFVGILFAITIGWYWVISPALIDVLALVPESMARQLSHLVALEFEYLSGGTGAGIVQQQQTTLGRLTTVLYAGMIALAGIGLASRARAELWNGSSSVAASSLVCLAIPLYGFLGFSVVAIHNLDADRVFQISMVVLAPFVVLGYGVLHSNARRVQRSLGWSPLAALLLTVFVINVGAAPQLVGEPTDFTFDDDVSDFAYTDEEIEGVEWFDQRVAVDRIDETGGDSVTVYTDRHTTQLFRSVVPPDYYEIEMHPIPTAVGNDTAFDDGYIVIRERSVSDDGAGGELSERERERIAQDERTEMLFDNGEMQIYEYRADA
ncbi:DUF2206 domain-containing protein [Natronorubrum sp. FCH18a]|uniref:DUF2206 domain-containing protein n=1 Tax=Natronorubrum sp. FCH18a TaxID=3447018 RepID=UPI003F514A79